MQKELLATLADLLGCSCLSDLKYITDPYELKSVLNSVPAQNYPLKQWNDAVSYLTGNPREFDSILEAREFLLAKVAKGGPFCD